MNLDIFFRAFPRRQLASIGGFVSPASAPEVDQSSFLLASNSNDKTTVRAKRRRRGGPADGGERERATAPQRRQSGGQKPPSGGRPPGGSPPGGGGSSRPPRGSGKLPTGGGGKLSPLTIGIILVLVIGAYLFGSGGSEEGSQPNNSEVANNRPTATTAPAVEASSPTATPRPATSSNGGSSAGGNASSEGDTWLIMLYQDADDKILEQDIYLDLNEAERIGSSDQVQIVAQVDRFQSGFQGDGNWTGTKRFYITQDQDLQRVQSQEVMDLGEVNMADGNTLIDFVTWAIETYPADKHALIMSDHGIGWPGGWSDPTANGRGSSNIPISSVLGDQLYLMELDDALETIRARTGLDKFELVGMDACLMGHIEVFSALAPHARYAVASQETEPALGWAYTGFLQALEADPAMNGGDLGRVIVQSYIQADQRIVDDQARAEFMRQGSPMGGLFGMLGGPTADQIARQLAQNSTLTAVDLAEMPALMNSVNDLTLAMQTINQRSVAQARSYAQSYTSVFGNNVPPSYIDLGSFSQLLKREINDASISQTADQVLAAIQQTVVAEKHGDGKPGSMGISIYFPNSQLYQSPLTGPDSYTVAARRFASESLWDDFLAFHYTGRNFAPANNQVAVPERGTTLRVPGGEALEVSPITLSSNIAAPGSPILLSADIRGESLGYVYLFVGFVDQSANAIFIADTDYLESADTREIDGVYYPDWGTSGELTMEFEWEPIVFAIDDGNNSIVAHFTPQSYGASFEEAIYTVDGLYTAADGSDTRYARLYFNNGLLKQVYGFTGENGTGAPREIIPQTSDSFTVLESWLDLGTQGAQRNTQQGGTLTFSDQPFIWKELDAAAGQYVVGFVVEDLDGKTYEVYEQVTVQ